MAKDNTYVRREHEAQHVVVGYRFELSLGRSCGSGRKLILATIDPPIERNETDEDDLIVDEDVVVAQRTSPSAASALSSVATVIFSGS